MNENSTRSFILMRLHSLAGIIPLGFFLIEHLISNFTALLGEAAYNRQIEWLHSIPFLPLIEIIFIGIPLLYHAGFGIYIGYMSKNNNLSYQYPRNWLFYLQRLSGLITLAFILYHLISLRLADLFFGKEIHFQSVQEHLANPWIFLFYIAGVLSTTFHFSNGLRAGLITWGITVGEKSQRAAYYCFIILFIILNIFGLGSLIAFY